jgi:hypothetical protein
MGMAGLRILAIVMAGAMTNVAGADPVSSVPVAPQPDIGWVQPPAPGQANLTGDGPILVPTVREYEWTFHVPVLSLDHRHVAVTILNTDPQARRWSYEMPALHAKRIKLWDAPEITCKYPDITLPNECKTVWHGVYADLPVLVNEHVHIDVEVPRVRLVNTYIEVDLPRWTWTEKRFRFSLPAFAPPASVDQVRSSLNGQRAAVTAATDAVLAGIDRQIEVVRQKGEDPARIEADDGSVIDLPAQRQALLDERDQELERLAAIDTELSALPARR